MFLPFIMLAMAAQTTGVPCEALEQQARLAMKARRAPEAAKLFEDALAACPGSPSAMLGLTEARILLANSYLMSRQPNLALAESERVLRDRPDDPAALKIKANAAYLLGDAGKAIATLIRLLDRHPDDEDGAYMLGRIYYQESQIDLAIGQFERALKTSPRSYKALDNLGLCYVAKGDDQQATRYFLSAIKLVEKDHPEYEWPYVNLAELLLKGNDAKRAFDAASMAANRNPQSARSFYVGAKALEQLGKPELSLNWAQRASALDPGYSDAWYLLARLYRKLGQAEKAKEARQRFAAAKAKEPARRR